MVTLVIHSVFCFSVELEEMAQKKKTTKQPKKPGPCLNIIMTNCFSRSSCKRRSNVEEYGS